MTHLHDICEPYRKQLPPNPTEDQIAWAFLNVIYHTQSSMGIYYIFEPVISAIDDAKCLRIVNRLSRLGLAKKLSHEAGNLNWYMSITDEGSYAIERFSSLAEYELHTEKQRIKNQPNTGIIIGGNVQDAQIGQSSSFGPLSISRNDQSIPRANEKQQKADSSKVLNVIWQVLIGVIIGAILLYIEHKTGWFTR
jgi:hypothetical protein